MWCAISRSLLCFLFFVWWSNTALATLEGSPHEATNAPRPHAGCTSWQVCTQRCPLSRVHGRFEWRYSWITRVTEWALAVSLSSSGDVESDSPAVEPAVHGRNTRHHHHVFFFCQTRVVQFGLPHAKRLEQRKRVVKVHGNLVDTALEQSHLVMNGTQTVLTRRDRAGAPPPHRTRLRHDGP